MAPLAEATCTLEGEVGEGGRGGAGRGGGGPVAPLAEATCTLEGVWGRRGAEIKERGSGPHTGGQAGTQARAVLAGARGSGCEQKAGGGGGEGLEGRLHLPRCLQSDPSGVMATLFFLFCDFSDVITPEGSDWRQRDIAVKSIFCFFVLI